MNNTIKTIVVVCLMACLSCSVFARNVSLTTDVLQSSGDVMPVEIEVPESVLNYFKSQGVDTSTTDVAFMSIATRNSIKAIYADNTSTINNLVKPAMRAALKEGSVETVIVTYGPISWTMKYSQDDENGF